jgi:hypothetical protein
MSEREIKIVRKGTTTSKLTIAVDGRIEIKLHEGVDKAGEEWLLSFARKVVEDARLTLPQGRTLRGRFRRKVGGSQVRIDLHAGSYRAREILKSYVSERIGLPEPPLTV